MSRYIDEVGNHYGRLLVVEVAGRDKRGEALWRCLCNCGEEIIIPGGSLRSGNTQSCGCLHRDRISLPRGQHAFNQLFLHYQTHAERRGLIWALTKEDFSFITQMNCHYCGAKPSQIVKRPRSNGSYTYNGIDRIDNSKGYIMDNVVPCCGFCNGMKEKHSYKEFLNQVFKIASYRSRR